MIRRFGLLYTLFTILVFVVVTILALARLTTARTGNLEEAEASFARLQNELASAESTLDAATKAARDYTAIVPTIRALILFDPDLGLRYVWTADAELLTVAPAELGSFRGFPDYRLNEAAEARLRAQLAAGPADGFYVDAVYRVLSFEDAYPPLRDSLISLLAFALLTVVVTLALGRATATPDDDRRDTTPPAVASAPEPHEAPEPHQPADPGPDEAHYEEIAIEELATDPGEPGTLFNPITGLSHRDHLERRLGLELERSAYNDQDLTCMMVRFPALSGEEAYVERAQQILATFQFEDLCFEYDETTFCVVLPNTELPPGLRQAESFRKRHPEAIIGLSARNGRLVEAHRVLTEADRSLSHAAGEPGGIVGFRPDPRKYRQFVTEHLGCED